MQEEWAAQPPKNPHMAAHYGILVYRPRAPLQAIEPVVLPYQGAVTFLKAHKRNAPMLSPASQFAFEEPRNLRLRFSVSYRHLHYCRRADHQQRSRETVDLIETRAHSNHIIAQLRRWRGCQPTRTKGHERRIVFGRMSNARAACKPMEFPSSSSMF